MGEESRELLESQVKRYRGMVVRLTAAGDAALRYLEGMELPYKEGHRPLHHLHDLLEEARAM